MLQDMGDFLDLYPERTEPAGDDADEAKGMEDSSLNLDPERTEPAGPREDDAHEAEGGATSALVSPFLGAPPSHSELVSSFLSAPSQSAYIRLNQVNASKHPEEAERTGTADEAPLVPTKTKGGANGAGHCDVPHVNEPARNSTETHIEDDAQGGFNTNA